MRRSLPKENLSSMVASMSIAVLVFVTVTLQIVSNYSEKDNRQIMYTRLRTSLKPFRLRGLRQVSKADCRRRHGAAEGGEEAGAAPPRGTRYGRGREEGPRGNTSGAAG